MAFDVNGAVAEDGDEEHQEHDRHPEGEPAYDATEVVHGIDLAVGSGEVFAVLGPNGAGKTTTIEILEGFRRRIGSDVRVLGVDPQRAGAAWRERIGVVLQSSSPEAELTAVETLRLYAGFYANPAPIDHPLELCGLQDQAFVRNSGSPEQTQPEKWTARERPSAPSAQLCEAVAMPPPRRAGSAVARIRASTRSVTTAAARVDAAVGLGVRSPRQGALLEQSGVAELRAVQYGRSFRSTTMVSPSSTSAIGPRGWLRARRGR